MKIAGLDIGTTGCKCKVFDENGKYLGQEYRDYRVLRRISGHEIDMAEVRSCVLEVIKVMAGKYPDIAGIGVTSFGETFVLTDEAGEPLHTAMLYTDPRGHEECKELIDRLGEMHIAKVTGLRPHEMYSISKLMWIKKHHPEIYEKAVHVLETEDFIVFSLTGTAQVDYTLATRSMTFDVNTLAWSDEIIEAAGVDRRLYPKTVPVGTPAGKIKKEVAKYTGLSKDTVIVSVSQDQVSAAIGAGAFSEDIAVDGAGTVECLTPVYEKQPETEKMYPGYYVTVPYVFPGKYVTYAFSYTGGALIQWCTENLAKKEAEEAKAAGLSVNVLLEKQYAEKAALLGKDPEEPSGLLVLPHFAGAATPYMDTGSRGAVIGLTTDTSAAEIYRGCLEGVAYEMYLNYRNLLNTGAAPKMLHATGGGAKSKVWNQIKADVLGIPITVLKTTEAGTVGSAMMTGIAIGAFKNLEEAASLMIEKTDTYYPRQKYHEKYMQVFKRYEKVYDAVRPLV